MPRKPMPRTRLRKPKYCVKKKELRTLNNREINHKRFCRKQQYYHEYNRDQLDNLEKFDTVIVSRKKMMEDPDYGRRRDPRWRVRIALTKLDDDGKKVYVKNKENKIKTKDFDYDQYIDYKKTGCVTKDHLWSSTNPKHLLCDENEDGEPIEDDNGNYQGQTKAQMIREYIKKWHAQRVKSDRKARQTDHQVYKDVEVIDLQTEKRYKFQVKEGTKLDDIDNALKDQVTDGNNFIWYDHKRKIVSFSDYKKLDVWKSKDNKYYLTRKKTTEKKLPKNVVIPPNDPMLNKHFSHRRLVWVRWNNNYEYPYTVKSSDTFADLAKLYGKLHNKRGAKFKVDERLCEREELVWDATSKAQMVYLVYRE
jgi:hypothetical protein